MVDKIPVNRNYIIVGMTDNNQNTISRITIDGSEGHAHLKLIPPFDIYEQPLVSWRYRFKDNTLYACHYTNQQMISIKKYLKEKYGINNMKINSNVDKYLDRGHKVDEDHGMGFSHNVSLPGDENTMNKPTIGYLKEYNDPEARMKSISTPDIDRSTKLLYQYIKSGQISYDEFEDLLTHFISMIVKKYIKR